MEEIWKPVPEFEDYEVSTCGRIRHGARILSIFPLTGKPAVNFAKQGLVRARQVHRVMAEVFLPLPEGKLTGFIVKHIDGDVNNNVIENLEWRDRRGWNRGYVPVGNPFDCKKTAQTRIQAMMRQGYKIATIATKMKTDEKTIKALLKRGLM